jgi:predicted phosphodiesterase
MSYLQLKKECCDMKKEGRPLKEIYKYFCDHAQNKQGYKSFTVSLNRWCKKDYPDELTLNSGTYRGFTAHDATVQVSGDGSIVQAWIKQKTRDIDVDDFLEAIKSSVKPYKHTKKYNTESSNMLEIPLFDMHFGVSYMDYYGPFLENMLRLISSKHWKKIVIPFGQDFFHNDSIVKGETTKGTSIEKVDMVKAVNDGQIFMYTLIESSLEHADEVQVFYTPGNHDRSISWMFIKVLLERFGPNVVDDSLKNRRVITFGNNAIMVTHGNSKIASSKNLAQIFSIDFPKEFAESSVREVHAGHLHKESERDTFGIMVRRLSTGAKTDEWSDQEDYIGAHKRFMIFEWSPTNLSAIHYIDETQ